MKLTATSKSGIVKQLFKFRLELHNFGDDIRADKLYKLENDVVYDKYLSVQQIKARFVKAMNLQDDISLETWVDTREK